MPFRRVDVKAAGAKALGILVPPGDRTFVALRPRGMDWDLLPVRWSGLAQESPTFVSFGRDEAAIVARQLAKSLEEADQSGLCPLETLGREPVFQVWLGDRNYHWILCRRVPGEPYRPLVFATLAEAQAAGDILMPFVHPGPNRVQEYYFNTQNFS